MSQSRRFIFSLQLGTEEVKRVVFPTGRGRRELLGSNGQSVGFVEVDKDGCTISIREGQAINIAQEQMY